MTEIMSGIIILLSFYLYSNYVVAAPTLHFRDMFQSGVDSITPSQSVPVLNYSHESTQESPPRNSGLLTGLLFSI